MNRSRRYLLLGVPLALAGCYVTPTTELVAAYPPIPPPRPDPMPKPPVSARPLIWQPGHWEWTGRSYVWTPGAWVPREGHGTLWQDGYWAPGSGGWTWVPVHWT
jgi:hypothetical protein